MNEDIDLVACLVEYEKGAEWKIDENDYDSLEWFSDSPKPTLAKLKNCWPAVLANRQAKVEAKKAAQEKLKALGLTEEDLELLGFALK